MSDKCIVLDVDGPLAFDDWKIAKFFTYLNTHPFTIQANYEYYLETGRLQDALIPYHQPTLDLLWAQFHKECKIIDLPTPGACEALNRLRCFQRHIATGRGKNLEGTTQQFLSSNFGTFRSYQFGLRSKSTCVNDVSAAFFIEDSLDLAEEVVREARNGVRVILFPIPSYQRRRNRVHEKVIMLEAEKSVHPDMTLPELQKTFKLAWEEIAHIIAPRLPAS